jgi:hypothetical protein
MRPHTPLELPNNGCLTRLRYRTGVGIGKLTLQFFLCTLKFISKGLLLETL